MGKAATNLKLVAAAALLTFSAAASAHDAEHCVAVANADERLACFDSAYGSNPSKDPVADFGKEQLGEETRVERASDLEVLSATVTAIKKPKGHPAVLTLNNEQVWQQVSSRFARLREGDGVTIKASRFGGYILANERGVTMRVRRIK